MTMRWSIPFAERLVGKEPSAEGFRSFLATNLLKVQGRPGVIARKQLKEIEVQTDELHIL